MLPPGFLFWIFFKREKKKKNSSECFIPGLGKTLINCILSNPLHNLLRNKIKILWNCFEVIQLFPMSY